MNARIFHVRPVTDVSFAPQFLTTGLIRPALKETKIVFFVIFSSRSSQIFQSQVLSLSFSLSDLICQNLYKQIYIYAIFCQYLFHYFVLIGDCFIPFFVFKIPFSMIKVLFSKFDRKLKDILPIDLVLEFFL